MIWHDPPAGARLGGPRRRDHLILPHLVRKITLPHLVRKITLPHRVRKIHKA